MSISDQRTLKEETLVVPCLVIAGNQELFIGINAQKIIGVVDCEGMSSLPASYFPFIGLLEYRQEVVPVMDLAVVLKQPIIDISIISENMTALNEQPIECKMNDCVGKATGYEQNKIVICQLCNVIVGILVNATYRIESLKNSEILHLPEVFNMCSSGVFNGLTRYRERFLYFLDLESILDRLGLLNLPKLDENPVQIKSVDLANKTVLVVDDSIVFRRQVVQLLETHQINYVEANDGQDGLEKFMTSPDAFDLILTDLEMPRMNGLEMARKIRESYIAMPFLFNSSISNVSLIEEIKAEYGYFLVKFQPDEILKGIRALLSAP